MNRKRLITGMTVILLLAVYTGMYIVLPAARQTAGKNEMSESRQEENQTAQADSTKRTVVLDSGHGGFDPGKESSDGILEKHINLAIAERLKELLDVEIGETTADRRFTFEVARCIGACGLAPAMSIDDQVYKQVNPDKLEQILERYYEEEGQE